MAARLGARAGLSEPELEGVAYGALLHDVGKIGVPESILAKAGPLEEDEWQIMRRHPEIGARICAPLGSSRLFAAIVAHHHERWDGRGYPNGLRHEAIPLGARIVGIVDTFDAMTHDRPYRRALPGREPVACRTRLVPTELGDEQRDEIRIELAAGLATKPVDRIGHA